MSETTFSDLESVFRDSKFWQLDTKTQGEFVNSELGHIYGDMHNSQDVQTRQKAVDYLLNNYRPKGLVEHVVTFPPVVGPLAEQYLYGREVSPSLLVKSLVGEETARQYGGVLQAAEDVILFGIAGAATRGIGALLGSEALMYSGTRLASGEILKTIPAIMQRDATVGGLYEVGKLFTTPPESLSEAALRVGTGAATFAGIGGVSGKISEWIGNKVIERNLVRETGSRELFEEFKQRLTSLETATYDDIGIMNRAAGSNKSEAAVNLRQDARDMLQAKQQFDASQQQMASETLHRTAQSEAIRQQHQEWQSEFQQSQTIIEQQRAEKERITNEYHQRAAEQRASERQADIGRAETVEQERQARRTQIQEEAERRRVEYQEAQSGSDFQQLVREEESARLRQRQREVAEAQQRSAASEIDRQRVEQASAAQATENIRRAEEARQAEVNKYLEELEQNRIETNRQHLTRAETMLSEMYKDPTGQVGSDGFVGNHPIRLPVGMLLEGEGTATPVVVDRFTDGQAILRNGRGIVTRGQLRLPADEAEQGLLDNLLQREQILPAPGRDEALQVMRSRVAAEQAVRLADLHQLREDFFDNTEAQTTEWKLRQQALKQLMSASGQQFRSETMEQIDRLPAMAGDRHIASVDNLTYREAGELQQALSGVGYENVTASGNSRGTVDISFTRTKEARDNRLSNLFNYYTSKQSIFDATERTYSGLTLAEHAELGKGFGLDARSIKRYTDLIEQTMNELSGRALRVPTNIDVLGIPSIEEQAGGKASAALIRPDAIVDAYRIERWENGDILNIPGDNGSLLQVQVADTKFDSNNNRFLQFRMLDKGDNFGRLSQWRRESEIQASGAFRDITQKLGPDIENPLTIDSPARTLGALINPAERAVSYRPVEMNYRAVQSASKDLGLKFNKRADGSVRLSSAGTTLHFNNLEESQRFVNGMKYLRDIANKVVDGFGGRECI